MQGIHGAAVYGTLRQVGATEGDDLDLVVAQSRDAVDAFRIEQRFPGFFRKTGRQDTVARGCVAAALKVAKHGWADFQIGKGSSFALEVGLESVTQDVGPIALLGWFKFNAFSDEHDGMATPAGHRAFDFFG